IYRNFAIAPELEPNQSAWKVAADAHGPAAVIDSILSSLATQLSPEGQQRVYRLLMYRDLPERIDSYRYTVYVRNDLLPLLNTIRY
nr:TIGR03663 family protein [Chloroflexia bacterium]